MKLVRDNSHLAMNRGFGTVEFGELLESVMGRPSKETKKTSFAPSGLGYSGACPRYWYYAFNGAEFSYENDGPSISNMDAGSDAGKRIAGLLKKAGILIQDEVPTRYNDPDIFGYIDALVRWKDDTVVCEIKTTKNDAWQKRVATNKVPSYQLIQLLIYMYVTKNDRGFFLTENKDTNELWILPIRMTEEHRALVERVLEWMRTVQSTVKPSEVVDESGETTTVPGEMPKRPFIKSSPQCKGCPVNKTCWDGWKRGSVNGTDPNPGTVTLPILELPK